MSETIHTWRYYRRRMAAPRALVATARLMLRGGSIPRWWS